MDKPIYAVIFKAEINQLDKQYSETAERMRNLAIQNYGCLSFSSACENNQEISISYWAKLENIQSWKQDPEHKKAQELGKSKWYKSYKVEILNLVREYGVNRDTEPDHAFLHYKE